MAGILRYVMCRWRCQGSIANAWSIYPKEIEASAGRSAVVKADKLTLDICWIEW